VKEKGKEQSSSHNRFFGFYQAWQLVPQGLQEVRFFPFEFILKINI